VLANKPRDSSAVQDLLTTTPRLARCTSGRLWAIAGWFRLRVGSAFPPGTRRRGVSQTRVTYPPTCALPAKAESMLRRKRHRWIKDALVAIGVAALVVGIYKLLGSLGVVLLGGP
jgi:hypothetical protein